jgi:hypothetical protein
VLLNLAPAVELDVVLSLTLGGRFLIRCKRSAPMQLDILGRAFLDRLVRAGDWAPPLAILHDVPPLTR